jgi:hypothetical protein
MPAIDRCHFQVVRALEKDGWEVDDRQYALTSFPGKRLFVDIQARKGERQLLLVEVKCFTGQWLDELYQAIGQYLVYQHLVQQISPRRALYLAIPRHVYLDFVKQFVLPIIKEHRIKLLVVDLEREEIDQWLP